MKLLNLTEQWKRFFIVIFLKKNYTFLPKANILIVFIIFVVRASLLQNIYWA